jgi:hypothetical protein
MSRTPFFPPSRTLKAVILVRNDPTSLEKPKTEDMLVKITTLNLRRSGLEGLGHRKINMERARRASFA